MKILLVLIAVVSVTVIVAGEENAWVNVLAEYDLDNNGFVEGEREYQNLIDSLVKEGVSEATARNLVNNADEDGDNRIDADGITIFESFADGSFGVVLIFGNVKRLVQHLGVDTYKSAELQRTLCKLKDRLIMPRHQ